MASTGVEYVGGGGAEKGADYEKAPSINNERRDSVGRRVSTAAGTYDSTHRKLKARHIQLIGIGYDNSHPSEKDVIDQWL